MGGLSSAGKDTFPIIINTRQKMTRWGRKPPIGTMFFILTGLWEQYEWADKNRPITVAVQQILQIKTGFLSQA